jgi:hypothetical protein
MIEPQSTVTAPSVAPDQKVADEYKLGVELLRHWSTMRRHDIVFVTTIQGAVLTIIAKNLPYLQVADYALTVIAAFVVVLGINSERRLAGYSNGYVRCVQKLERRLDMTLLAEGLAEVQSLKWLVSNYRMFISYYSALLAGWLLLWTVHAYRWWAEY